MDGKNTTHATTLCVYQSGYFGKAPVKSQLADHSKKKQRSLDSAMIVQDIQEFSSHGKRPKVPDFVGKVSDHWFQCMGPLHSSACEMDLAWALCRLLPMKIFNVDLSPIDLVDPAQQKVPGWSGFHATVSSASLGKTVIGYCPMIEGSPTEYSTVYTVMKISQKMMASLQQKNCVLTFDLAIYCKAKEIQWRAPREFSNMTI